MKVLKKVVLIALIILYVLTIKSFADTGKVNIQATRIRKENNTTSEILTVIYENDEVEILEKKGEWVKVKYKEFTGYVMEKYLDLSSSSNNKTENNIKEDEVKKDQVSVYDNQENTELEDNTKVILKVDSYLSLQPNFMSKKTDSLVAETSLTIKNKMGKWIQVTDGTITGWLLETKVVSKESSSNITTSDIESDKKENENTNNTSVTNNSNNTTNANTAAENTTNNTVSNKTTSENTTISNTSKKGKINVETAKVRKEPSTSAGLINFLDYGDEVSITKETGDWYYVKHLDIEGYVNKRLITITDEEVTSRGLSEERKETENNKNNVKEEEKLPEEVKQEETKPQENTNTSINNVVDYAKQFLGYSYVVGGKTPESGFDCSGFTRYVYKNFGYSLASTSSGQTSVGREVSRQELIPGDLILFYNEGKTKIGHTGIYIGNGEFIHSANPERGVVIDNLNSNSYYNERFVTARRIVE